MVKFSAQSEHFSAFVVKGLNRDLFKEELVSTGGVVALYIIYVFERNVRKLFLEKLNLVRTIEDILLHLETMLYVGWRTMLP